jgi:flagellar L-ring protein precursor FlgH
MIHWATPSPHAARNPYLHAAIAGRRRRRAGRRALIACLWAIPLLLALAMTLRAQGTTPPNRADSSSAAARPAAYSWTSDRRTYLVGDIITVLIDERTLASANKTNTATDRKSRRMDAGADLPQSGTGPAKPNPNISISSSNNGESQQRGDATRGNSFLGEMAVRVIAVKDGNLQIKGQKLVDVDKNKQQLSLTGWVRSQDISMRETVESSRVADAQLTYTQQGSLGKPRSGIMTRILGVFWP